MIKFEQNNVIDRLNIKSQEIRAVLFRKLLKLLTMLGITGNMITNVRLVLGICFLFVFPHHRLIAAWMLIFALFTDIVDGALARFQNTASDRGKFLDIFVDTVVYMFNILVFFLLGADPVLIAFNIFIIPVVYLLATIKKQEFEKTDWIIKPYPKLSYLKAIPVLSFFLFVFAHVHWLNQSLFISNVLSVILSVYYFIFIQIRWKKKYNF